MDPKTFGERCRPVRHEDHRSVAAHKGFNTYDNGRQRKRICKTSGNSEGIINFGLFCKPYHSWKRGANENTNGLIRQYIPKGTDFSEITDEFVSWVENKLNNRLRKRLGYLTPNEKFNSILTN